MLTTSAALFFLSVLVCTARPGPTVSGCFPPEETARSGRTHPSEAREDSLRVLFWNLENFFDWRDGGENEADREFSATGARRWTRRRFMAKAAAIAKTLLWTADHDGSLPEVFAVAEVENAFVLRMLLQETVLRKTDYAYVHFDSPDRRGIDVALLYRRSRLRLLDARPVRVTATRDGDTLRTRDLLLTRLEDGGGRTWTVLVSHFPSKFGGAASDWKRAVAADRLRCITDSLRRTGEERILVCGDFNDTPAAPVFRRLTAPAGGTVPLVNIAEPLARRGLGTIRYEGRWELIDQFFVPPALAGRCTMEILAPPFLTVRDNVHSGDRPFRTWLGPRYIGGVSDHRPVLLRIVSDKML